MYILIEIITSCIFTLTCKFISSKNVLFSFFPVSFPFLLYRFQIRHLISTSKYQYLCGDIEPFLHTERARQYSTYSVIFLCLFFAHCRISPILSRMPFTSGWISVGMKEFSIFCLVSSTPARDSASVICQEQRDSIGIAVFEE